MTSIDWRIYLNFHRSCIIIFFTDGSSITFKGWRENWIENTSFDDVNGSIAYSSYCGHYRVLRSFAKRLMLVDDQHDVAHVPTESVQREHRVLCASCSLDTKLEYVLQLYRDGDRSYRRRRRRFRCCENRLILESGSSWKLPSDRWCPSLPSLNRPDAGGRSERSVCSCSPARFKKKSLKKSHYHRPTMGKNDKNKKSDLLVINNI